MSRNIEAARAAKRAYQREWRRKNPEKVKAATKRYWLKVAARQAAERETTEQTETQEGGGTDE